MLYWVYILRCNNNALYTGYTNDLQKRYQEHLDGKGAKYTRSFKPILIEVAWQVSDKSAALRIEAHIKKLSKQDKLHLISEPQRLNDAFGTAANILLYSLCPTQQPRSS